MTWTPLVAIGLLATGLGVGFLSGLLGVGGGFLVVPILVSVFGVPADVAVGTGLAQMLGMSAAGFRRHFRYGNVIWKLAIFMVVFTTAGGLVGDRILMHVKRVAAARDCAHMVDQFVLGIFAVLLAFLAVVTLREAISALRASNGEDVEPTGKLVGLRCGPYLSIAGVEGGRISIPVTAAAAFATGLLLGILGIGGGVVMQPLMIYVLGIPTRMAVGTGLVMIFGGAFFVVIQKAWQGDVDLWITMLLLALSPVGVQLGALVCKRVSSQRIRFLFAITVIAALVLVGWKLVALRGA